LSEMNLAEMSLQELTALSRDIDKAIKSYEARRLTEARAALEAKAQELGVSLDEILGVKSTRKRGVVAAKYAHPENPALTWSGRGIAPKWVKAHEALGGSRDDLLIK
jgi:DNA-binding protein H-NS